MYKLNFYVPPEYAQQVKEKIFATGAGAIGNYSQCSWETLGEGQFRPLEGAMPTIGKVHQLERVKELKIEILCTDANIQQAVSALFNSHPYEEPAFEVISIENHKFRPKS